MLPPSQVFPALSKAFRYSITTDLRCSSVMVCLATAIDLLLEAILHPSPASALLMLSGQLLAFLVSGGGRPISESQNGTDRSPASAVSAGRRRGDAIADAVKAGNWCGVMLDHVAGHVGLRSTLGIEIAAGEQSCVVRSLVGNRKHGRIGPRRRRRYRTIEQQLDLTLAPMKVKISST